MPAGPLLFAAGAALGFQQFGPKAAAAIVEKGSEIQDAKTRSKLTAVGIAAGDRWLNEMKRNADAIKVFKASE